MSPRRAGRRPAGLESVLSAIARTAAGLCEASDALIYLREGDHHRLVAKHGRLPERHHVGQRHPVTRTTPLGLAVLGRRPVHVRDIQQAQAQKRFSGLRAFRLRRRIVRTLLAMPLLRDGRAVGGIVIRRTRIRPFTPKQIALLRTFADQAAIAIENARLSDSLEARNRELVEALQQQTATAEILRVISRSPIDVQPVLDTIARSAVRLCEGYHCSLFRFDGELQHFAAHHGVDAETVEALRRRYPRPPHPGTATGRAILEGAVIHARDIREDQRFPESQRITARAGYRAVLAVPMFRDGQPIGAVFIVRREAHPFSDKQIELVKTFADQAVIAIENVRLFTELQARNCELTEALERQTATAEILRIISASPTDLAPVQQAVVERAARLCEAANAVFYRLDPAGVLTIVASHGPLPTARVPAGGLPLSRDYPSGRAILDRRTVQVEDLGAAVHTDFPGAREVQAAAGIRSLVATPLLREGSPVGALLIRRTELRPFTDGQVALLETFASQAVIAIENVRLFTELQARNRELTEALEQQTATAEILRVISSSPTDLAPVLEAIARNAGRVCGVDNAILHLVEGDELVVVTYHGHSPTAPPRFPLSSRALTGRAILEKRPIHVADIAEAPDFLLARERVAAGLHQTMLAVPLLREGVAIGGILSRRLEVRPFTDKQIALLQTFADQAVIAIENVRLFTELQARNQELTDALDRQTATAEILSVISRSQTDVRPVFEAIADSAMRLFRAWSVLVCRVDGEWLHLEAIRGGHPDRVQEVRDQFPVRATLDSAMGASIVTRAVDHMIDAQDQPGRDPRFVEIARRRGVRSALNAPMLRDGEPVGAVLVTRAEVRPFSEAEINLLRTFADQAVIALENARLFSELQQRTGELARSVDQLRALGEVGQAVSSTLDLDAVLQAIVSRAAELAGTRGCSIWEYDESTETFRLRTTNVLDPEIETILRSGGIRKGEGAIGRAALTRAPVQIPDVREPGAYEGPLRDALLRAGGGSVLTLPLLHEDRLLGGLTVSRRVTGEFPPETVAMLTAFAAQSAIALQNARLYRELQAKSRELEIASRHKSQFLANMSHELRTPLNAILGYGEMMADGIYGELPPPAKDVLGRVDASGRHLLGLINDVLDLSKIEAGQLTLALAEYSMEEVARTVIVSVEALAAEKNLVLGLDVAPDLPTGHGDQRRLTQVLLNLVGNALKFTEEGGVGVQVTAADGTFAVSVRDTGPGIAPADQERIFEEFQQADTSTTRPKGGTGLGLAISRRIVALHGGRLWVESVPGEGATFRLTVPIRVERQAVLRAGTPS